MNIEYLMRERRSVRSSGYHKIADELEVLSDIRKLNESLKGQLQNYLQAEQLAEVDQELRKLQLRSDPGGSLLTWIGRHRGNLPEEVQVAYDHLSHNYLSLSLEEEALCWETLVYFKIHHTFIDPSFILKPFLSDLNYLEN